VLNCVPQARLRARLAQYASEWFAMGVLVAALGVTAVGATAWLIAGVACAALGSGLALLMLGIAVADARHFVIPDALTASALILGTASAGLDVDGTGVLPAIAEAVLRGTALAISFGVVRAAYYRWRRRHGIGIGDIKLAAVAGVWLTWTSMAIAVELAALTAVASLILTQCHRGKPLRRSTRLPFGLYFAPAIWLVWLLQAAVLAPQAPAG